MNALILFLLYLVVVCLYLVVVCEENSHNQPHSFEEMNNAQELFARCLAIFFFAIGILITVNVNSSGNPPKLFKQAIPIGPIELDCAGNTLIYDNLEHGIRSYLEMHSFWGRTYTCKDGELWSKLNQISR